MTTHSRLGPSADRLAVLIRALDQGDGPIIHKHREDLLRALEELKRFRKLYPRTETLRVMSVAVLTVRNAMQSGEVFFTPWGELTDRGVAMAEDFLRQWGIDHA